MIIYTFSYSILHFSISRVSILTETPLDVEDLHLQERIASLMEQKSQLEAAIKAKTGGWKRPDEFNMKELDTMLKQSEKLNDAMREIFTQQKMRSTKQALANFRALLAQSYKDQGFEKDLPKVEAIAKKHYLVLPETVQHISANWHAKEAKDKDTKNIHEMEKEYHLLLYDHDWLLRNSYRPIPNLGGQLKRLHSNRDSLLAWIATPVKGNSKAVGHPLLVETEAETEVDTEAEAEAEAETETEAGAEEVSFAETGAETEVDAEADEMGGDMDMAYQAMNPDFSFAETEATAEDKVMDLNIEGAMQSEAELEADAEFGSEDSYESLAAEAKALDAMEAQFHKEGLLR